MAEVDSEVRRRAAERAQAVLDGTLSPEAFRDEFADVEDRAVAELLDVIEHRPAEGLLGGGDAAWRNYRESLRELIEGLLE